MSSLLILPVEWLIEKSILLGTQYHIIQMILEKFLEFEFVEDEKQVYTIECRLGKQGPLHMVLNQFVNFTSNYQQPIVNPTSSAAPDCIRALCRIKNTHDELICPHFFTRDEDIEPAWNKPLTYWRRLRKFGRCISTDFSIYENMVDAQKRWNSFRNKFLSALWQKLGIDVIPAPLWGNNIADIDYYMEGWPVNSLIAINSTGVGKDKHSQHLYLDGYNAMLEILRPMHIIRYGRIHRR